MDATSGASFARVGSSHPYQSHNMKACCGHTLLLFFFHVHVTHLSVVFNPCPATALVYPQNKSISLSSVSGVDYGMHNAEESPKVLASV